MRFEELRSRWSPLWTIGLVLVLAVLTAVAAKQITTELRGDTLTPAAQGEAAGNTDATNSAEASSGAAPLPPAVEPGTVPEAAASLAPGTGSEPIIGEPEIEKINREPVADRVSLQAATVPDELAPAPAETTTPTPDESDGGGPLDAADPGSNQQAPIPRGFGVGVRAETVGHYARLIVGVSGGPNGLAAMRLQLSDGDRYELSASEVEQLHDGGTFVLVHRFEPTLTPQPQRATVVATDGTPTDKAAFVEFDTQAEFRVGFSPLTVTALEDCDFFGGKNDFQLEWDIDGRHSVSRFDLGEGESYVEHDFRRGVNGVRYRSTSYGYSITIAERDGYGNLFEPWTWPADFAGASRDGPGRLVDIIDLGTHRYPVTLFYEAIGDDDCRVRFDYSYTVALADTPPSA